MTKTQWRKVESEFEVGKTYDAVAVTTMDGELYLFPCKDTIEQEKRYRKELHRINNAGVYVAPWLVKATRLSLAPTEWDIEFTDGQREYIKWEV